MNQHRSENIVVLDLGTGNLRSVEKAVQLACTGVIEQPSITVTNNPEKLRHADRILLPGVGAFSATMNGLNRKTGLREVLERKVLGDGTPFLGICVGMQILAETGYEHGSHAGLGWLAGSVKLLEPNDMLRVPHMGWNRIAQTGRTSLLNFQSDDPDPEFYFLHSFHMEVDNKAVIAALCAYGEPLIAAVTHWNIFGVQFHPEKSQRIGIAFLRNFLRWQP